MKLSLLLPAAFLSISSLLLSAADPAPQSGASTVTVTPKAAPKGPEPTLANVPYGTHERQVLDFYKAQSDKPTPLLFYIHGGGWVAGDKFGRSGPGVKPYL